MSITFNTNRYIWLAVLICGLLGFFQVDPVGAQTSEDQGWKAGVARVEITPDQPMWMAGYGFRDHASEGTLHELWVKALALEDADGNRAVLVTSDLLGIPRQISNTIRDRLSEQLGLSRAQIILNSSHTHSGPVLENALYDVYPLDDEMREQIANYSRELEDQTVALVEEAFAKVEPATVASGNGVTRFAVNRRENDSSELERLTELEGPSDHSVPVLRVQNEEGELMAAAFGYACHATVLGLYEWSGDYPGFAQKIFEEDHPEATALFFAGAGADQNPLPRRTVALARQYGRELAAAVDRVLEEPMNELEPRLTAAYSEIDLRLSDPASEEELASIADNDEGWQRRWAGRILQMIRQGEGVRDEYPYPVQVWTLGDQALVSLGGEVVVDYAVDLKNIFGQDLFVLAYSNDVMSYIPSVRVLREGGYEAVRSQSVYGLPSTWTADVESRIIREVIRLAGETGLQMPETPIVD
jgi:hypothetical protein